MLVVSPTRELAAQIAEEAKQLSAFQQNFTVQVRCPQARSAPFQVPTSRCQELLACMTLLSSKHRRAMSKSTFSMSDPVCCVR